MARAHCPLRQALAIVLLPLQRALAVPVEMMEGGSDYLRGLNQAQQDERAARVKLAAVAERAARTEQLAQENARLRALLDLRPAISVRSQPAEVLVPQNLREIVALPSVHPEADAMGTVQGEAAMAGWMSDHLRALGADVSTSLIAPGRPSVVGVFEPARKARARWSLVDALVIHRHGPLRVGEAIMMVATASLHRGDAFAAADYLMDYLKSRAPFWKREISADGSAWVAAKTADEEALGRW